jgi:hypothetical protein
MACGYDFIYNKTPSELYDVSLVFLEESYTNRPSGSGIEIETDFVQRNAEMFILRTRQSPVLQFGIEIVFDEPVDIFVLTQVKDWLNGSPGYNELQICVDNFNTFYFNCYLQLNEDLVYAGGYRGVSATVICDSPWAWEFENEMSFILNPDIDNTIYFNNLSADSELLRPIVEFTMVRSGDFSITNTETGKVFQFSNLMADETITIDNKLAFINSSVSGQNRVPNFNKVFLKLIKGTNKLVCSQNVQNLKIRYKNAKRIGGAYY